MLRKLGLDDPFPGGPLGDFRIQDLKRLVVHTGEAAARSGDIAVVRTDKDGNKAWALKDGRANPAVLTFDPATAEKGRAKFAQFMAAFGQAQLARREEALGQTQQ